MAIDVFVSAGRASTEKQEAFIKAIEELIRNEGVSPRAVGRTDFSSKQPLKFIQELLQKCEGTVIIAFERIFVADGEEKRGSPSSKPIRQEILPTVWNQIEAAMAYVLQQPLLIIVEETARTEGLLEAGYDWYVLRVAIDPSSIYTPEFRGVFNDWIKRVNQYHAEKEKSRNELPANFDFGKIRVSQLFSLLTPGQLWKFIIAIVTLIIGGFYIGMFFSKYFAN